MLLIYACMNTSMIFSITDLRLRPLRVLAEAKSRGYAYLLRRSKAEAAIVDIDYLNALQEAYEDYLDTIEFDQTVSLKRIPLSAHK